MDGPRILLFNLGLLVSECGVARAHVGILTFGELVGRPQRVSTSGATRCSLGEPGLATPSWESKSQPKKVGNGRGHSSGDDEICGGVGVKTEGRCWLVWYNVVDCGTMLFANVATGVNQK